MASQHFAAHGWVVFEDVFPRQQAQELAQLTHKLATEQMDQSLSALAEGRGISRRQAQQLLARAVEGDSEALMQVQSVSGGSHRWYGGVGGAAVSPESFDPDVGADGRMAPRKLENAYEKDERFRAVVHSEELLSLAWQLLGGEKPPTTHGSQLFTKAPGVGSVKPRHQDNYYFRYKIDDHLLTCWVALDDADEGNGCMRFIDGSHKKGLVPHDRDPTRATYLVARVATVTAACSTSSLL